MFSDECAGPGAMSSREGEEMSEMVAVQRGAPKWWPIRAASEQNGKHPSFQSALLTALRQPPSPVVDDQVFDRLVNSRRQRDWGTGMK